MIRTIPGSAILARVGGAALLRYGTLVRQLERAEGLVEANTRSDTVRYVDRDGVIRTAEAHAPVVAWRDLDGDLEVESPVLLLQAPSGNDWTQSEDLSDVAWTKTRTTITANDATAPDGTTTADALVEDATASATHYLERDIAAGTDNAIQTASFFVKAATRTWVWLEAENEAGDTWTEFFNLATGARGTGSGALTAQTAIDAVGDGWFRLAIRWSKGSSTGTAAARLGLATGDSGASYTGDGSSKVHVWGAQWEKNMSFLSSYMAAAGSAATRVADQYTATSWPHAPGEVTSYTRLIERGRRAGTTVWHVGDPSSHTATPRFGLWISGAGQYEFRYDAGTDRTQTWSSSVSTLGQVVELRATVNADGSVTLAYAIDGGSETVIGTSSSQSAPFGSPFGSDAVLQIGQSANGRKSQVELLDLVIASGADWTLDELRRVA